MSVVLYLRLSRQFQVCLFFYEKKLSLKKAPKGKINNFPPLKSFCAQKIVAFNVFYLLVFVLFVGFDLICVFVCLKFFRNKKKKKNN